MQNQRMITLILFKIRNKHRFFEFDKLFPWACFNLKDSFKLKNNIRGKKLQS